MCERAVRTRRRPQLPMKVDASLAPGSDDSCSSGVGPTGYRCGLVRRAGAHGLPMRGVIESMTGARFVHDSLEELGWEVLIADAAKVKGPAPLACKTDKIDARVLSLLSQRDLVPEIWLPDPSIRREWSLRWRGRAGWP